RAQTTPVPRTASSCRSTSASKPDTRIELRAIAWFRIVNRRASPLAGRLDASPFAATPARRMLAAWVAASATLMPALAAARPSDFPRRAAGLWEIRSVGAQAAGLAPAHPCIGEGTDTA